MSIDLNKLFEGAYLDDEKNAASDAPKKEENKTDNKTDIKDIDGSTAGGAHDLPPEFLQTLQSIIKEWLIDNNIESMEKAAALQWRACCLYIGQYIKNNNIVVDKKRTAREGGKIYSVSALLQLVDLWEYLCALYKKTPLASDFIAFAGVSHNYFYGGSGGKLTTAGGVIWKKVQDIQQGGIASGIVDGRENPTGKIYFSKAVLGWSESGIMRQNSDDLTENNGALPDLSVLSLPYNKKQ